MVELKDNMRQQNDSLFSQILNRIRIGEQNDEDIKIIQRRLVSNGDIHLSAHPFDTALRLYPRTVNVDEYNESQITSLASTTKLYILEAEHAILQSRGQFYANVEYNEVPERLIPQNDKECAALPRRMKMAIGARVMLRRNINCGDGLVNGARGTIVGFKWPGNAPDQSKPGELPVEVYVRFLDPNVGRISRVPISSGEQDVVPIRPISAKFFGKEGTLLQRMQVPLILCGAATIHKVQGLSLDAAVIDLGTNVFEPGMAYVALSRVRTLNGLALLNFEPSKVKANKRVHEEMGRLCGSRLGTYPTENANGTESNEMEIEE
jgi:ATP-dependent DNA helicase PIF1